MAKKIITTVGELRESLKDSDDREPIIFELDLPVLPRMEIQLDYVGSSGGGSLTVLGFSKKSH
jgi:hypothetical protein